MALAPIQVAPSKKEEDSGGAGLGGIIGGIMAAAGLIALPFSGGASAPLALEGAALGAGGAAAAGGAVGAGAAAGTAIGGSVGAAAAGTAAGPGLGGVVSTLGTGMSIGSGVGGFLDKSESGGTSPIGSAKLGATADEMGPISRRFQGAGGGPNDILQSSIQAAQATPQVAQSPEIMGALNEAQKRAQKYRRA